MQHTRPDDEDAYLAVLRLLEQQPQMSQREIAAELGVSLGKTNYCLKALLEKGWLKMQNFHGSSNKLAYAYLLTPSGIVEKSAITARFLKRKMQEYEHLQTLIHSLQDELKQSRIERTQS
ncbi:MULTISPECIES: MarR family EPS-associated transcriptional regulator [unclassified Undibacterium]|uniref:MarR family EPS-associated transcriptional regulator n=1 Tax=unclassified Undibacterium TaxID=2630295 RepID=UPI002AC948F2|nr:MULTISPECIES: MarR family EPS-associated transcriptional regulator [unclassified Undibacterium]MEB0140835.1 MarR family EPS-associated transcriptional regulator [Undibacterium sp. CCC2.1]MEB0173820.1 MarR family EPS-associated transcriptional regulator [Undibacterium sp. CCC1.1]MEB0177804.1 MarR family EPS-associated transcriptional regulator [Undibacterium sp. CCC3.4]MEB0217384.1 MarR family EPS-associated transcriptional regulator [Undibacterium sp. 5I2]WPX42147.1 MarR family EPS-associat